jgi:hypothetical protein
LEKKSHFTNFNQCCAKRRQNVKCIKPSLKIETLQQPSFNPLGFKWASISDVGLKKCFHCGQKQRFLKKLWLEKKSALLLPAMETLF